MEKVFSVNLFDLKDLSRKGQFDFLLFLFPYYLKKALSRGLFKTYTFYKKNDMNIRGQIDMARHIKENTPFRGNIACNIRERTADNYLTQLIRHTIEVIRTRSFGTHILACDKVTKHAVEDIVLSTPSYKGGERDKIIRENLKLIKHPYFTDYAALQKLCLAILSRQKVNYGADSKKIYGLLFDVAWLWEEYINTLLYPVGFTHFGKRIYNDKHIYLLKNRSWEVFPDFFHEKNKIVLDTKYKNLDKKESPNAADKHQLISYMYTLHAEKGGFIYPSNESSSVTKFGEVLNLINSDVSIYPINILINANSIEDFINHIAKEEEKLKHYFL